MSEKKDELDKLEQRASGTMLYLSLLEVFAKFDIFNDPQKVVEVLCGALEVFLKKMIKNSPNGKQIPIKISLIKGFEELVFRLKEFV